MENFYYQISIQLVFAVKHRESLITSSYENELHSYIGGILLNQKHKPLAINSHKDHIHIFFGMYPNCNLSDLVRDIKSDSSTFINSNQLSPLKFHWQEGYGAFSYSMSHRDNVIRYIRNQERHHQKKSFKKEYLAMLKRFDVEYQEPYLFDFFEK
mgnify:FL=1